MTNCNLCETVDCFQCSDEDIPTDPCDLCGELDCDECVVTSKEACECCEASMNLPGTPDKAREMGLDPDAEIPDTLKALALFTPPISINETHKFTVTPTKDEGWDDLMRIIGIGPKHEQCQTTHPDDCENCQDYDLTPMETGRRAAMYGASKRDNPYIGKSDDKAFAQWLVGYASYHPTPEQIAHNQKASADAKGKGGKERPYDSGPNGCLDTSDMTGYPGPRGPERETPVWPRSEWPNPNRPLPWNCGYQAATDGAGRNDNPYAGCGDDWAFAQWLAGYAAAVAHMEQRHDVGGSPDEEAKNRCPKCGSWNTKPAGVDWNPKLQMCLDCGLNTPEWREEVRRESATIRPFQEYEVSYYGPHAETLRALFLRLSPETLATVRRDLSGWVGEVADKMRAVLLNHISYDRDAQAGERYRAKIREFTLAAIPLSEALRELDQQEEPK